ncbi:type II secretion system protein [Candidatus Saccharibacteria bacterium]|jgi:type II secretory pathway pseudopilin PulG|nr:type II secretion system protein [Candidatus Saccharibacteria bacterium]
MNKKSGFTIIEIFVVAIVLMGAGGLFLYQKNHIQATARDDRRKADINTIYHNLEKVYYSKHKSYPQYLNEKTLPGVHPDTLKDPNGITINESKKEALTQIETAHSDYSYRAKQCNQTTGNCKSYELQTKLEKEADYKKQSNHK